MLVDPTLVAHNHCCCLFLHRISRISGVQKIHNFHVWQLSGAKLVATVHLQCDCDVTEAAYMKVASKVRIKMCLWYIINTFLIG